MYHMLLLVVRLALHHMCGTLIICLHEDNYSVYYCLH